MASFVLVVSVDGHGRSTAQGRVSFPLTLCPINVDFLGAPSSPVSMTADCSRTLQRTGRWNLGSCRRRLYCKHGGLVSLLRTGGFWSERCRRSLRTSEQVLVIPFLLLCFSGLLCSARHCKAMLHFGAWVYGFQCLHISHPSSF